MNLQEIFDQLTYGELSQLSIGGGEAGVINKNNYKRIIPHINLALTALYKRFSLKENRISFPLQYGGYGYNLDVDDILKIERVLTDLDEELSLNDESDKYSCFTTSLTTLIVAKDIVDKAIDLPDYLKTTSLTVVYRANHPKLSYNGRDLQLGDVEDLLFDEVIFELPDSHLEPLLLFIAARMMTPLGVGQFEGQAGNNYMKKYELACEQLVGINIQIGTHQNQNNRLTQKGWV